MRTTLFALLALGFVLWSWRDSLRAREAASALARRACEGESLQMLDDTVALVRMRIAFPRAQPRIRRIYAFEFSRDGTDRLRGTISMLGAHLESLHMERPPEADAPAAAHIVPLRRPWH